MDEFFNSPDAKTVKSAFSVSIQGGLLRDTRGGVVAIAMSPLLVGRDERCGLVVDDPEVSATHCELRATPEGVSLTDLDSRNGTWVGGVRVRSAVLDRPCALRVGRTVLGFEPRAREEVEVGNDLAFGPLVGVSPSMRRLFRVLRDVAPTELSVLITGETGTGKEVVAQALHDASRRAAKPFIVIDCGAIPPGLAESILFGHEKGSFTGAGERRAGAFQEADGGTVFLDELGELPVDMQPKLLRVLAEGQVKRVGSSRYEKIDVRVVAATRRDLPRMSNAGKFRSDLYFRLAQVQLELPALRARREDISLLVQAYCERSGHEARTTEVIDYVTRAMANHDWPGNVRELLNVAAVVASLPPGSEVRIGMLPVEGGGEPAPATSAYAEAKRRALEEFERRFFGELFRATGGNISEMTRRTGLARHHIRTHLRRWQIV